MYCVHCGKPNQAKKMCIRDSRLSGAADVGAASAVGPDILDGGDPVSGGSDVPQGSLPCAASHCCWRLRLLRYSAVSAAGEFAASAGGVLAVYPLPKKPKTKKHIFQISESIKAHIPD